MFASIARALNGVPDVIGRVRRAAIVYALAFVAGACGLGFLLAAGFMLAAEHFGAIAAAAGFGVGLLAIAVVLVVIHAEVEASARAERQKAARADEFASALGAAALGALTSIPRVRPGLLAMLAPIAAIAACALLKENGAREGAVPNPRADPLNPRARP